MGAIQRAIGLEKDTYHATQLNQRITTPTKNLDKVVVELSPHPENNGPASMAEVLEAVHTPSANPTHALEIWQDGGEVRFFFVAHDEESADAFRRGVNNNYPDTEVRNVSDGERVFVDIGPDDNLVAGYFRKQHRSYDFQYLPIGYYNDLDGGYGTENNPIAGIISAMNADKDTRVVIQQVLRPVSDSWSDRSIPFIDLPAKDAKDRLDENDDSGLKKYVDDQTEQLAFSVNLRVLAISPNETEARNRVSGIANLFENKFKSKCGARLQSTPVDTRIGALQPRAMKKFVNRMRKRQGHNPTCTVLGVDEATCLHIPSEDAGASNIRWKRGRSGSEVPVDRPKHSVPDINDLEDDGDSGFVVGGDS